jgi:hypothetical protein
LGLKGLTIIKYLDKKDSIVFKFLKIFVWLLIIASVGALYISLRSNQYSMEYGIIALGLWIAALGINYIVKKRFK